MGAEAIARVHPRKRVAHPDGERRVFRIATVQELERRELETNEKNNAWWLGALQRAHILGLDPLEILAARQRIDALTPADLREAFVRYFPMGRHTRVSLVPEAVEE